MYGHVSTLSTIISVGEELAHKILEGKSTLLEDSCLSILCKYRIVWGQCCRGTDTDTFFTCGYLRMSMASPIIFKSSRITHHVETQTTLSLCLEHDSIHNAHYPADINQLLSPIYIHPKLTFSHTAQHILIPRQDLFI